MSHLQPFEIRRFPNDVVMVQEADHRETVAFYLVSGSRDVALIDTGLGSGDLPALVARLSPKHPVVLQTHLHWDHIGASRDFADVRAHATEIDTRRAGWPWDPPEEVEAIAEAPAAIYGTGTEASARDASLQRPEALQHGYRIDLGGRSLDVIHTPGHSPGSLSFLDRDARVLFCGDVCYFGQMLLFVDASDLAAFRDSLAALAGLATEVDAIYPAHGPAPLTGEDIVRVRDAFECVWHGRTPDWHGTYAEHGVAIHDFGPFAFLLPPG